MRYIKYAALAAALGLALSACTTDTTNSGAEVKDATSTSTQASPAEAAADTPAADPPPVPDPDGTYTSNCDYVLGDFSDYTKSGYRFLADAKIHNTGNIGTITEVKAIWFQAGGGKVTETKEVRTKPGQTVRVGFTKPVGQDEIDLIQSLDYDDQCKVRAAMIDTFGQPTD